MQWKFSRARSRQWRRWVLVCVLLVCAVAIAVARLTRMLLRKYDLTAADIYFHRDLVVTRCPGNGVSRQALLTAIATAPE